MTPVNTVKFVFNCELQPERKCLSLKLFWKLAASQDKAKPRSPRGHPVTSISEAPEAVLITAPSAHIRALLHEPNFKPKSSAS